MCACASGGQGGAYVRQQQLLLAIKHTVRHINALLDTARSGRDGSLVILWHKAKRNFKLPQLANLLKPLPSLAKWCALDLPSKGGVNL
jgi:hypothetical protein